MTDETGTRKIRKEDLKAQKRDDANEELTGEEIESLADLFASAPPEDDQDTGSFEPVRDEDTGKFKPVE